MRLLFLTPQLPYPPHQGTTIRNFNILKHLAPNHAITLLTFSTREELERAEPLRALCEHVEIAPYPSRSMVQRALTTLTSPLPDMALRLRSSAMQTLVDRTKSEVPFDLAQIEGIEMAGFWAPAQLGAPPAFVFDDHNAEYVLQKTAFESDVRQVRRWHAALYSWIQCQKLTRYERDICARAGCIVAASDTDARHIARLQASGTRQTPIAVIPNGVDTDHFVPSDEVCAKPLAELGLVFAGKMDFRPNIDAMVWFCREILPRIRAEMPLAHITIVGQKPAPRVRVLAAQPGVDVTGWVPDTRPYVADAAVYVVPLRMGSGTRLKVLEAMAMGKAIVSTSLGAEGIGLVPGRDALIADSPDEFGAAVTALLNAPDRRRALGAAARALAVEQYNWRTIVPRFESVYESVIRQTRVPFG